MKKTWTVEEKVAILKDIDNVGVTEGCRKHGIYATTYYDWKHKYEVEGSDGLIPQYKKRESKEIRNLQKENAMLKKLLAEKEVESQLKSELLKKRNALWQKRRK